MLSALSPGNPASVLITAAVPFSERAAVPAARRISSAGQESRALPRPTVSTLATGSDATTSRFTWSLPPLAFNARSPASISVTASAASGGTVAATTAPGSFSSPAETTGTISTASPATSSVAEGSEAATVTAGAGYPG
jgi:hypothetical protein